MASGKRKQRKSAPQSAAGVSIAERAAGVSIVSIQNRGAQICCQTNSYLLIAIKMSRNEINARIGEEVKIAIHIKLKAFLENDGEKEYAFPSSFTSEERKYVHQYAATVGLKSKSREKGYNRFITVYKQDESSIISKDADINMGRASQHQIIGLLQRYPVSEKERKELQPFTERDNGGSIACGTIVPEGKELNCTTGRLSNVIPQIPPAPMCTEMMQFRQTLPIMHSRTTIIRYIADNPVILIGGDTGCGKTTQVPQYILEYCTFNEKPCRIITTEPRRLAALSVAERVACERGENMGQTVGYQIRLESKVSPKTLLTFCTNGVLLRTLMGGENSLSNVTHIIVDEVHERDKLSDLLLLIIKDLLPKFPHLKLILMSATFDTERFARYFGDCPIVRVPGIRYDVSCFFLEDILKQTRYMTPAMKRYQQSLQSRERKQQALFQWCKDAKANNDGNCSKAGDNRLSFPTTNSYEAAVGEKVDLDMDPKLKQAIDESIKRAWILGRDDDFDALLSLIINENVSVDYQHSETGVTTLIAATCHGKFSYVEALLNMGANTTICTPNDWDAMKWATCVNQQEIYELLEAYCRYDEQSRRVVEMGETGEKLPDVTQEEKELLEIYHHCFNDEDVDINLILSLLHLICVQTDSMPNNQAKGAILVFLPGYDDIVALRELILGDFERFDSNKYVLYTLHSQMQSNDQKRVFKKVAPDVRKIILSTNLAETSITIDDVVFVIDSGKVKEQSYDLLLGVSMLKSVWISQASAIQRRGRAGRCRPGVCYHLFSRYRYNNMQKYQVPEILRVPIHELCLQTKLLAPVSCHIVDFLAKALDPPCIPAIKNSVQLLKTVDALDPFEQLTELGLHLLDLPVEPNLGKMILYSVVLKCLDPVLTIVCSLAYRDPFLIPSQPGLKRAAAMAKRKLSAGTLSDHMTLLRGFQQWQKARNDGYEKSFLEQNFISAATMEMIVGMRAQLLGQLRASGFVRARGAGDIRDLNTNSENWSVVKAAICAGCYPNIIRIDRDRYELISQKESKIRFHPSSVLNDNSANPKEGGHRNKAARLKHLDAFPADWLVYEEMTRIGRISYARCCTLISPIIVAIFAGPARLPSDALVEKESFASYAPNIDQDSDSESEETMEREKASLKIDEWIMFKMNPDVARLVLQLRQKWHSLFLRRMSVPAKPLSQSDEAVIKAIVEVLSAEEQALRLQQPVGIGQRPRPMSTDFCPPVSNVDLKSPVQNSRNKGRYPQKPYFK